MIKVIRHRMGDISRGAHSRRSTSLTPPPPKIFKVFVSILSCGEIRDLKEAINVWHEPALLVFAH